jgi:hypothetical protein
MGTAHPKGQEACAQRGNEESLFEKAKVRKRMRGSCFHPNKCDNTGHTEEQPPQQGTAEPTVDTIQSKEKRGEQEKKGESPLEVDPDRGR